MDTSKINDMTVEIPEIRKMKKAEIVDLFDKTQTKWIAFLMRQMKEYDQKINELRESVLSHPEHAALKKDYERLVVQKDEITRQRDSALKKVDELKEQLKQQSQWKKPGRRSLDPYIADRIRELKAEGLSIRKIVEALKNEGLKASKGSVWNVIHDHEKNGQIG